MASRGADAVPRQMERAVRRRNPRALLEVFSETCLSSCPGFGFAPVARIGPVTELAWRPRQRPGSLARDLWGQLTLFKRVRRAAVDFERLRFVGDALATAVVSYRVDGTLKGGAHRSDLARFRLRLRQQADGQWRVDAFGIAAAETLVRGPGPAATRARLGAHPVGPPPRDLGAPGADLGADLAVADVDGDGDLDVFLPGVGLGRLLRNAGHGHLSPAAPLPGVSQADLGLRARFGDVDGDGDPDLFVAVRRGASRLLENRSGRFRPAQIRGLDHLGPVRAVAWIDVDGDRRLDLVLAPMSGAPGPTPGAPAPHSRPSARQQTLIWLRNEPGVGFRRPAFDFPEDLPPAAALCTGDLDADGRVDLVLVPLVGAVTLLRNQQGSGFAVAVRTPDERMGRACSVADLDGDGDLDVLVAAVHSPEAWKLDLPSFPLPSRFRPGGQELRLRLAQLARGSFWLRNEGGWRFSEQRLAPTASLGWDLAVAAEDIDGDGRPEVALAGGYHPGAAPRTPRRTESRQGRRSLDALFFTALLPRRLAGLPVPMLPPGPRPLGARPGVTLLANQGAGFLDLGTILGLNVPGAVRGAAWADLDRDGSPELLLRLRRGALISRALRQPLGHGRTLTVRLQARGTPVTGAQVAAQGLEFTALAQLDGGAADRPWAETRLGLRSAVRADRVVVFWPDGTRQTVQDLDTAARYRLARDGQLQREGRPAASARALSPAGAAALSERSPTSSRARTPRAPASGATPVMEVLGLSGLSAWRVFRAVSPGVPAPAPLPLKSWFGRQGTVLYLPPADCPNCLRYLRSLDRAARRWRSRGVRVAVLLPPRTKARSGRWQGVALRARFASLGLLRRERLGQARPAEPRMRPRARARPPGRLLVLDATGRPLVCFLHRQPSPLLLEYYLFAAMRP